MKGKKFSKCYIHATSESHQMRKFADYLGSDPVTHVSGIVEKHVNIYIHSLLDLLVNSII